MDDKKIEGFINKVVQTVKKQMQPDIDKAVQNATLLVGEQMQSTLRYLEKG